MSIAPDPFGFLDEPAAPAKKPRKKASTSPTQRSLAKLRDDGYTVAITERWNAFAKIRQDLFGFVDVLALKDGETLAVQCCAGSSVSERVKKISDHENVAAVRAAGWRIVVHGWVKRASGRWECREVDCS